MTAEEAKQTIDELKAQGASDQDILGGFYKLFQDGKLSMDELDGLAGLLGFQLSDEFKAMSPEQQKVVGNQAPAAQPQPQAGAQAPAPAPQKPAAPQPEDDPEEEKKAMHLMGLD